MKIALIGSGKTGSFVRELAGPENVMVFDVDRKPTAEALVKADVAIVFVPGGAADEVIEPLLQSEIPAVWGTTGYEWPGDLSSQVRERNTRWVLGSNFSLGMNLIRKCLQVIGKGSSYLKNPEYRIHEVHHAQKKDAPSGTALKWEEWLGVEGVQITSERVGDVKGIHSLSVETDYESIYMKHEAHDRALFADGAIWTAQYLLNHPSVDPGVYTFEAILDLAFSQSS